MYIFKTSLAGNGGAYSWSKYDEKGKLVEQSAQLFDSEADAEKAIRTIANETDIIEVENIKNINTAGNTNVNLVKPEVYEDRFAGMNVVPKSVLDNSIESYVEVKEEVEHPNVAKMEELDIPEPTEAQIKAYNKKKEEAEKEAAAKAAKDSK